MNKEEITILRDKLAFYNAQEENNNVRVIEFHLKDGRKFGIDNSETIDKIISLCVNDAEQQLHKEQFGDYPEELQNTEEYGAVMTLQKILNSCSFNPQRVAEAIPYMHRTLQQSLFRMIEAIIMFMADGTRYRTDARNQASHEISMKLAEIFKSEPILFI